MEVNNNLDKNSFNGTGDEMYHKIGLRENGKKKKLDTKSIINSNNNQLIIYKIYKKNKIYDLKKYVKMETVKSHKIKIPQIQIHFD